MRCFKDRKREMLLFNEIRKFLFHERTCILENSASLNSTSLYISRGVSSGKNWLKSYQVLLTFLGTATTK